MKTNRNLPVIASLLTLSLGLSACAPKTEDKPAPAPAKLQFVQPAVGPELTAAQIAQIKAEFQAKSTMVLPPGELLFPLAGETSDQTESRKSKEADLAKADPASFQLLQNVKSTCGVGRPTMSFDSTVPLNGVSDDNIQTNDHVHMNDQASLIGENCAMPAMISVDNGVNVDSYDSSSHSGSVSLSGKDRLAFSVKDPEVAKKLAARGIVIDSKVTGIYTEKNRQGNIYATTDMSGHFYSQKNDLPYSMNLEFGETGDRKTGQVSTIEYILKERIQFPDFAAELVVHFKGDGKNTSINEIYLNGRLITQDKLNALFSDSAPQAVVSKMGIIDTLK